MPATSAEAAPSARAAPAARPDPASSKRAIQPRRLTSSTIRPAADHNESRRHSKRAAQPRPDGSNRLSNHDAATAPDIRASFYAAISEEGKRADRRSLRRCATSSQACGRSGQLIGVSYDLSAGRATCLRVIACISLTGVMAWIGGDELLALDDPMSGFAALACRSPPQVSSCRADTEGGVDLGGTSRAGEFADQRLVGLDLVVELLPTTRDRPAACAWSRRTRWSSVPDGAGAAVDECTRRTAGTLALPARFHLGYRPVTSWHDGTPIVLVRSGVGPADACQGCGARGGRARARP